MSTPYELWLQLLLLWEQECSRNQKPEIQYKLYLRRRATQRLSKARHGALPCPVSHKPISKKHWIGLVVQVTQIVPLSAKAAPASNPIILFPMLPMPSITTINRMAIPTLLATSAALQLSSTEIQVTLHVFFFIEFDLLFSVCLIWFKLSAGYGSCVYPSSEWVFVFEFESVK